jgi:hypothetical protein
MLSANTVAQNPGGSVIPPLSPEQLWLGVGAAPGSRGADDEPVANSSAPMGKVIATSCTTRP